MKVYWIFVSIVVAVKADYHEKVGIPMAARVKHYEDRIFADTPAMESRIAAGIVSRASPLIEHPYAGGLIIQLQSKFISMCGATLVTDTRLVTTAQCLLNAESIEAVLGSQYLFHGGIRVVTTHFIVYPDFGKLVDMDGDVGIVILPKPVKISETLYPIEIAKDFEPDRIWGEALVWGLTENGDRGKPSDEYLVLRQVRVLTVYETVCVDEYMKGREDKIYEYVVGDTVCARGAGRVGTRGGDTGGPIIVERNGTKVLIGVVSRSHVPGQDSLLLVGSRLRSHRLWVLTHKQR